MGLFDFVKQGRRIKELSQQVRALQSYNVFNNTAQINQNLAIYPSWDIVAQTDRYLSTDDIYSIIRKLSTTAALVPLYGYLQTPDAKSFQQLQRETKSYNPVKRKSLQTKALTDLPEKDPVALLLESPAEGMSKYEFFEACYSFLFLFGEVFMLKERPDLGTNAGMPVKLHFLYPQFVVAKVSVTFPRRIVAFDYRANGVLIQENIPVEDVIHIKYFNPNMTYLGNELRGLSPLQVLAKRLTRLDSNMDTSVAQLQNAGVPGILWDKSLQGEEAVEIMGKRQDNLYRYFSNKNNKGMPYAATGDMGYVAIGSTMADLSVAELAGIDFDKLCNAYGVSNILFNENKASTESNVMLMIKSMYTNTVLPNVFRVRDGFIRGLLPDFRDGVVLPNPDPEGLPIRIRGDGKNRYIDADISDITELHQDLEKKAAAVSTMWHLTPNEKREMLDWDRFDDPVFDEPWIPTGYTPLSEFQSMPPISTTPTPGNPGTGL